MIFTRLRWAFVESFHSTFVLFVTGWMIGGVFLSAGQSIAMAVGAIFMILPTFPLLLGMQHYCDMFDIVTVRSTEGIEVEIGHREAFKDRYRFETIHGKPFISHTTPTQFKTEYIFAQLLDNDILVVCNTCSDLQIVDKILQQRYQFYSLIANCKKETLTMFWSSRGLPFVAEIT